MSRNHQVAYYITSISRALCQTSPQNKYYLSKIVANSYMTIDLVATQIAIANFFHMFQVHHSRNPLKIKREASSSILLAIVESYKQTPKSFDCLLLTMVKSQNKH
jgi:hypothetical protein